MHEPVPRKRWWETDAAWVAFLNAPAVLLIISAAGVYNSFMLYLEGDRILAEAATGSQERFAELRSGTALCRELAQEGITTKAWRTADGKARFQVVLLKNFTSAALLMSGDKNSFSIGTEVFATSETSVQ